MKYETNFLKKSKPSVTNILNDTLGTKNTQLLEDWKQSEIQRLGSEIIFNQNVKKNKTKGSATHQELQFAVTEKRDLNLKVSPFLVSLQKSGIYELIIKDVVASEIEMKHPLLKFRESIRFFYFI